MMTALTKENVRSQHNCSKAIFQDGLSNCCDKGRHKQELFFLLLGVKKGKKLSFWSKMVKKNLSIF